MTHNTAHTMFTEDTYRRLSDRLLEARSVREVQLITKEFFAMEWRDSEKEWRDLLRMRIAERLAVLPLAGEP